MYPPLHTHSRQGRHTASTQLLHVQFHLVAESLSIVLLVRMTVGDMQYGIAWHSCPTATAANGSGAYTRSLHLVVSRWLLLYNTGVAGTNQNMCNATLHQYMRTTQACCCYQHRQQQSHVSRVRVSIAAVSSSINYYLICHHSQGLSRGSLGIVGPNPCSDQPMHAMDGTYSLCRSTVV